mmetsp:Transcript_34573/g.70611  ORF Transcript_34573/g.70611 Transcript_34573/m.70611 type:complete len:336 (+) Transcript_34573:71-1078(+)
MAQNPCQACSTPWEESRGFLSDGRHSRFCRSCGVTYCSSCKYTHMVKTPGLVFPAMVDRLGGAAVATELNSAWLCRSCAGGAGLALGQPCSACSSPWVDRSSFLGLNSQHSRECCSCVKSFCHTCKDSHMVRERRRDALSGNSTIAQNQERQQQKREEHQEEEPTLDFFVGQSATTGGDSIPSAAAAAAAAAEISRQGLGSDGANSLPPPDFQSAFRMLSSPFEGGEGGREGGVAGQARPPRHRYECLECRALYAYNPQRRHGGDETTATEREAERVTSTAVADSELPPQEQKEDAAVTACRQDVVAGHDVSGEVTTRAIALPTAPVSPKRRIEL